MVLIQPNSQQYTLPNEAIQKKPEQDPPPKSASTPTTEDKLKLNTTPDTPDNLSLSIDLFGNHQPRNAHGTFGGMSLGYQRDLLSLPLGKPNHQLVFSGNASGGFAIMSEFDRELTQYKVAMTPMGESSSTTHYFNSMEEAQAHQDKWMESDNVSYVGPVKTRTVNLYDRDVHFNGKLGGGMYFVNRDNPLEENFRMGLTGGYHTLFNAPYLGTEVQGLLPFQGGTGVGLGWEKTMGVQGSQVSLKLTHRIGSDKY